METFLPICWHPSLVKKNPPKCCASRLPKRLVDPKLSYKRKIYGDRFFGDRFVGKKAGLRTQKPSSGEIDDKRHFSFKRPKIFN
jgi:hypothetical protein